MDKIALFPGTFDPATLGHVDVIERILPLVDKLYVGIGVNANKDTLFSLEQRVEWLHKIFKSEPKIEVVSFEGLTVDFCKKKKVGYIVRGLRSVKDFEYEEAIADMNHQLAKEVDTLFLFSSPEFGTLASTLVRDVIRHGGDLSAFLPKVVMDDLSKKQYIQA